MRLPRNAQIWLPGVVSSRLAALVQQPVTHVWLLITDHFEPQWRQPPLAVARQRVATWREQWPVVAAKHRDDWGRAPRYCFFYPEEEYRPELLEPLAEMTRAGIADVEIHLHHDGEGEANFRDRMSGFVNQLASEHGLLRQHQGRTVFGFIHGNWALGNSHPDGRFCGLNNEITLLQELGCYADFTMPAAPSPCQTRTVNSIYRAVDDPAQPRSHDTGRPVCPGDGSQPGLLMVQGPLTVRRHNRKPMFPSVEAGELSRVDHPSRHRISRWLSAAPRVGSHQFIKLHTHGAQEANSAALLGADLDALFTELHGACKRRGVRLGYATAWEAAGIIEALAVASDPMAGIAA
jgi:hypothetical protein